MAPILLTHEEVKQTDEENLIVHSPFEGYTDGQCPSVRGLPIESGPFTPLIFLVPNLTQQVFQFAVSMLNLSNILQSLLLAAWADRDDIKVEVARNLKRENEHYRAKLLEAARPRQVGDDKSPGLKEPSPGLKVNAPVKRGSFIMTFTTISPKNNFKKLLALSKGKDLNTDSCSWIRAFQNVKRHKLFQLKSCATVKPVNNMDQKRR